MPMSKDSPWSKARFVIVLAAGVMSAAFCSALIASILKSEISSGQNVQGLAATLLGCVMIAIVLIGLFCLCLFHCLSFRRKITLAKAVRLSEAMQMLQEHTHRERLEAIRHHNIRVFKTNKELPFGVSDNVSCKEVSTFLSPMFFNIDRLNAIGSTFYCCDLGQIQGIIDTYKGKWSIPQEKSGEASTNEIAWERKISDLHDKAKEANQKYTAAAAREARLKKKQEETESHMAVMVELANKVSNECKPPRTITRDEIKAKYLAIGKIHGITEAPCAYIDIFRKNMPKEIINLGGAPKQGTEEDKT